MNKLGDHLKKIRKQRKLSTTQVANKSIVEENGEKKKRISQPFLSQIETGKHCNLSLNMLLALCEVYKVSFNDLLFPLLSDNHSPLIPDVEFSIRSDSSLTASQKEALLAVYREFVSNSKQNF